MENDTLSNVMIKKKGDEILTVFFFFFFLHVTNGHIQIA